MEAKIEGVDVTVVVVSHYSNGTPRLKAKTRDGIDLAESHDLRQLMMQASNAIRRYHLRDADKTLDD